MSWKPEVDEIKARRAAAKSMGGPEAVELQHDRGRLTVRERIAALVDPNSLEEHWMPFTGNRDFKDNPRLVVQSEGVYCWDHIDANACKL